MKTASPQLCGGCLMVIFMMITPQTAPSQVPPSQRSKPAETRILVIQGTVEVSRAGFDTWQPAQTNQVLRPGDRVRTGQRSRADEKAFFELGFREQLLEALAEAMPTARKKEEVPRGFILAANLSLRLHGEHAFLAWERGGCVAAGC